MSLFRYHDKVIYLGKHGYKIVPIFTIHDTYRYEQIKT